MLRISKLTDYALLIMSHLAKTAGTVMSASILAHELHLSVPTVSKILKMLTESGLVRSKRGSDGGYQLARPAKNITVAHIIQTMEGKLALTTCCHVGLNCNLESFCTLRENWRKINNLVQALLSHVTLSDMLNPLLTPRFLDVQ